MNLDPVKKRILDTIAEGEARSYQDLYGGHKFTSFQDHPGIPIPVKPGLFSTAAGRYQMTAPTWAGERARLRLTDFSPKSQDAAAWSLASRTYSQVTGRDLAQDGAKGQVAWQALAKQWPSLARFYQTLTPAKAYSAPLPPPGNDLAPGPRTPGGLSLGSAPALPSTGNTLAQLPREGPSAPDPVSTMRAFGLTLPQPKAWGLDFVPVESDPFQLKEASRAAAP
jgi:muramidase (phage lysozyme)